MQEGVVDVSDPIKSADLCNRCRFESKRHCSRMRNDCSDCDMNIISRCSPGDCKCLTVKWNTPCPYFEEDEK